MSSIRDAVEARAALVRVGALLAERGLAPGTSGNLSVRLGDGYVLTPTNARLGSLDPARLSILDREGALQRGDQPTKEVGLHLAVYDARPDARAIVHLHATSSVAVSCLAGLDPEDVLPPLTPYYVMRVGKLPLLGYHPPGDPALAAEVRDAAREHHALLLANHGPVVAGATLDAAASAAEELEEAAKLHLLLDGRPVHHLTAGQVAEIRLRFPG